MTETLFSYNGFTSDDRIKSEFGRRPIYTDDGLDYLYTEITLSVRFPVVPADHGGTNSVTYYKQNMKALLEQPRGNLQYTVDGVDFINQTGPDAKKGPFPQEVSIEDIRGVGFYVRFSVITYVVECDSAGAVQPDVLSNRWSMSATIGTDLLTTRTITGRLIVNGSRAVTPDDFRGYCVPPKPSGFDRKMNFIVQSDGLAMDYTITDTETDYINPFPISAWDANYNEVRTNGSIVETQFFIKARGAPGTNTADVLAFCVDVASSRIDFALGTEDMIKHTNISEELSRPEVTLVIQGIAKSLSAESGGRLTRVGQEVPAVTGKVETDPGSRANYLYKLFSAAAGYSCQGGISLEGVNEGTSPNNSPGSSEGTTYEPTTGYVSELPTTPAASEEQAQAPYTTWTTDLTYDFEEGIIGPLPRANSETSEADVVRVGNRIGMLSVTYVAERYGQKPNLPKSVISDDNFVLIKQKQVIENFDLLADGKTKRYRVDGGFKYAIKNLASISSLIIPINPTLLFSGDESLSSDSFNLDVVR